MVGSKASNSKLLSYPNVELTEELPTFLHHPSCYCRHRRAWDTNGISRHSEPQRTWTKTVSQLQPASHDCSSLDKLDVQYHDYIWTNFKLSYSTTGLFNFKCRHILDLWPDPCSLSCSPHPMWSSQRPRAGECARAVSSIPAQTHYTVQYR